MSPWVVFEGALYKDLERHQRLCLSTPSPSPHGVDDRWDGSSVSYSSLHTSSQPFLLHGSLEGGGSFEGGRTGFEGRGRVQHLHARPGAMASKAMYQRCPKSVRAGK